MANGLRKLIKDNKLKIQELTADDIGRWVNYHPCVGEPERGRIKSWNDKWIFVVYNCAGEWHRFNEYTAAATNPNDLSFA